MAGARKPIKRAGETSKGAFAREAREAAEGRRKKKRGRSRQSSTEAAYVEAEAAARVGDHAITPELVRGTPYPTRRAVAVDIQKGPAAELILGDLLTVLWAEIRALRDAQHSSGHSLPPDQFDKLRDLSDATTKVLREERRQNELDDWSRLSEADLIATLPEPYQKALASLTDGEGDEED